MSRRRRRAGRSEPAPTEDARDANGERAGDDSDAGGRDDATREDAGTAVASDDGGDAGTAVASDDGGDAGTAVASDDGEDPETPSATGEEASPVPREPADGDDGDGEDGDASAALVDADDDDEDVETPTDVGQGEDSGAPALTTTDRRSSGAGSRRHRRRRRRRLARAARSGPGPESRPRSRRRSIASATGSTAADPGDASPGDAPASTAGTPAIEDFFAPREAPATAPTLAERLGLPAIVLLSLSVVAAALAVAVALGWFDSARDLVSPPEPGLTEDPPPGGWQPAVLLATTADGDGSSSSLRGLAVLASDRSTDSATILLVPTSTVTDVPGFGSFTLEEAWDFGGSSLIAVTIDNLLGLRIDGVLTLDADAWASWFEPMGGATLDIPARIVPQGGGAAGIAAFEAGSHHLTPQRLAEYLVVRGEGETELQGLPRTQRGIEALSSGIAADPEVLDDIVEASRTLPGTATPQRIRTVLGEVAAAHAEDAATTVTLPVVPLGSGADEVYRADEERVQALMEDRFAASRDPAVSGERLAVQILNGNARPGVGQDVADALADGRYRIVLTGNADRFTYRETRILVYTEDAEDLAAAQDIRERLGVGTIERAGTPQSVVDVTIIVGADFPT